MRRSSPKVGQRFVALAAVATIVPWAVGPVVSAFDFYGGRLTLSALVVALGTPHVATTLALYLDPEMRPVLVEDRWRAVVAPLVALALLGVAFASLNGRTLDLALVSFASWQIHHFARQNLGMFTFVCMARGIPGATERERQVFHYAGLAGMVGIIPTAGLIENGPALRLLAGLLLLLAAAHVIPAATDPVRRGALVMAVLFFAPLVVFTDGRTSTVGFAAAHGAQYLLMMGHLRNGRRRASAATMIVSVVGLYLAGGWLLVTMSDSGGALAAFVTAAAGAHFLADARLWKARRSSQRDYLARRFAFSRSRSIPGWCSSPPSPRRREPWP